MRRLALLLLAPGFLIAQEVPRAVPVDPALQRDAGQDWFQHGRNVYESAKRSSGPTQLDLYQRSVEIFSRYLNDFPDHENSEAAWWYLGQAYFNTGRPEDAKRCFHSLLNRFGRGRYAAAAAYTLAADHFNNRQYALAATLFEKLAAIAARPADRHRGQFYAGRSYELMGRDGQAISSYRALVKDPDPGNAYLSRAKVALGGLLVKAGKPEDALELFIDVADSISTAETRGEAALNAGAVAAKLGQVELSDKYLNLILSTPGMEDYRPEAQITLMVARYEQKNYEDVIRIFRRSTERAEGELEARRLMLGARAFMMLNRNADALPLFREIERMVPTDSDFAFDATYYRLLCFYRIEGRYVLDQVEAFLGLYATKRARDPKIHTALLMKAETIYAEGDPKDAADVYRSIDPTLLTEKNRRGMLYQRGRCMAESGDPAAAVASLTQFIEEYPDDARRPLALAARARSHDESGQFSQALADFNALINATDEPKLLALAFLESAEIHKQQNDLDAMIARYLEFLEKVSSPKSSTVAKANYWTGWGMVKRNRGAEAIPYLTKARSLAPDLYKKHAGLLLCLIHLSEKNATELTTELETAIAEGYSRDLPDQLIRWAADQAFNGGSFRVAAKFYDLVADSENPELSPKEVWRFLGKARIESGDPTGALIAINHSLSNEVEPAWQADGLNDRARALYMLERYEDAMKAAEAGLELRPEGRVGANLHLVRGDIFLAQGNTVEARRDYIIPVQLMDDNDRVVKPRALHQLVKALEQEGKTGEAAKYRQELETKYPDWKPE